ncbi:MAG: RNA polymerase factor sigma-70 [Burkholderiales bacterium]|nr:RNA polymerase factor sigma-70 [Burkholderiales bacterium]
MNKEALSRSDGAASSDKAALLADTEFLGGLRLQMLKFARMQLSDQHLAEDAVQEAFIGALKSAGSFGGRAALKTWVFAILKNKIADTLRQKHRLAEVSSVLHDREEDEDFSELFDKKGFWQADQRPAAWPDPEQAMRENQFWRVFETCLDKLPGNQARVFMMREFIELDTDEICASVGISVSNLNVMLHRARLRLRECLETRWFVEEDQSC